MSQVAANSIYSKMDRARLFKISFCLKHYYCIIFPSIDLECSPSPTTLIWSPILFLPPTTSLPLLQVFSHISFFSSFLLFALYFPFSSSVANLAISSTLFSLIFFLMFFTSFSFFLAYLFLSYFSLHPCPLL